MPNSKPPYGEAFWTEAVRLAHEPGNTITQVARDLGVSMEPSGSMSGWPRSKLAGHPA